MRDIELEDFLAIENGLQKEQYIDSVNEQGREKYTPEEENARLRKVVYALVNLMAISHPEILTLPEYKELLEYYYDYEGIKAQVKARLNMN